MDAATAETRLRSMVAASEHPTLTDDQITELVDIAQARNWDLRSTAAEGWRWKAAKVAGAYTFADGDQRFNRSEMHAMCMTMAELFASKRAGTVRTPSAAVDEAVEQLTALGWHPAPLDLRSS
jgi:hypothetical protein